MNKRFLSVAIGVVVIFLAVAVLFYINPFSPIFDSLFFGEEEPVQQSSVQIGVTEIDTANFIGNYTELNEIVKTYFIRYYSQLGSGTAENIEGLYAGFSGDYLVDRLSLYAAEQKKECSRNDLSFSSCELTLNYISAVSANSSFVILTMEQSASLAYDFSSGFIEQICGDSAPVLHSFTFKKTGGKWKIINHSADGGEWGYAQVLLERLYSADGYVGSDLTYTYLEPYFTRAKDIAASEASSASGKIYGGDSVVDVEAEYAYDRESAVAYAKQWTAGGRFLRNYTDYGRFDNDSADFTSQCLFAGGIPMDTQGDGYDTQWKWYGARLSYTRSREGCTASWYECDKFYSYCKNNSGFGLAAVCDVGANVVEAGDIVQFIGSGITVSQGIVTAVLHNENGEITDYLITMHSFDRKNYALSAIQCQDLRFIKIIGYNTTNV